MEAPSARASPGDLAAGAGQEWLGNSAWQVPELEISRIESWPSITAASYHRGEGESIWRGDRHRIAVALDQVPPLLMQVEQGSTRQIPLQAPGGLTFTPPGLTVRTVHPAGRFAHAVWDTDLYSTLLPELGAAVSRFEHL